MAHLVAQRARPVKFPGFASGRAVHRDHLPEGHTERTETRHTQRAHREVLMIRIHLDLHRAVQLHVVLRLVGRDGLSQHIVDVRIQQF